MNNSDDAPGGCLILTIFAVAAFVVCGSIAYALWWIFRLLLHGFTF